MATRRLLNLEGGQLSARADGLDILVARGAIGEAVLILERRFTSEGNDLEVVAGTVERQSGHLDTVVELVEQLGKELDRLKRKVADVDSTASRASYSAELASRAESTQLGEVRALALKVAESNRTPSHDPANLATAWRGELTASSLWLRGDLFRFHGSLYLALCDGTGSADLPRAATTSGNDPIWLPLVGVGSPGGGLPIDPGSILRIVSTVPASTTAFGFTGQIAYGGGYRYDCVASSTWRRSALTTF